MTEPIDMPSRAPHRRIGGGVDGSSPAESVPRRAVRRAGAHHVVPSQDAPVTLFEAFSTISIPIQPGLRISATTVLFWSIIGLILFAVGGTWAFGAMIVAAGIGVVAGWNSLSGIDLPVPAFVVLLLASLGLPLSVVVRSDLGAAASLLGFAFIALVGSVVSTVPSPVEHYRDGAGPDSGVDTAIMHRRRGGGVRKVPTSHALASAVSALLLVAGGPSWLGLVVMPEGALVAPVVCVIVAAVVWGDQIGSTYRVQSLSAAIVATLAGGGAAYAMWILGEAASLTPVIFPQIAAAFGEPVAVTVFGAVAGLAVALLIILVDGILGDHVLRRPPLAAISRGCAKFLIAGIPVYALVRTGGI